MRIDEAVSIIELSRTIAELQDGLQTIAEGYGFAFYNFMDSGSPHSTAPYYFGTTGEWEHTYRDNSFLDVDPYVAKARRTNLPFHWASLPTPPKRRGRPSGLTRLMDAAFGFGLKEGLVVPYHFRDDFGTPYSALCAFYWKDPVKQFKLLLSNHHLELHLVVIYFMHRLLALRAEDGKDQIPLHSIGRPTGSLTDRERDVLAWAARGKTSAETAVILNLSELTIETHIRNALQKLNASNRTHAVAKSLAWGLIDL